MSREALIAGRQCIRLSVAIWLFSCFSFGQSLSPAKSETIAYLHGCDRPPNDVYVDLDVYSMNADGTNVKALTHDCHYNHSPSWSSDGRRIVFIHGFPITDELSVMDRDGGNSRQLRVDPSIIRAALDDGNHVKQGRGGLVRIISATWLPNGKIAATLADPFLRTDGIHIPATFLLDPDGQGRPQQILSDVLTPNWSPDGRRLAFVMFVADLMHPFTTLSAIYSAEADGGVRLRLTSPRMSAEGPAWSPDGKQIAFAAATPPAATDESQIFVMSQDGSGIRQLTNDPAWEKCWQPSWSPDGQRIAFSCRATRTCVSVEGIMGNGPWPCVRRIFVISVQNPAVKLIPISDQDATNPVFAPN